MAETKRGFPGSNLSIIGKAADASTVSAKHGTQEIVEVCSLLLISAIFHIPPRCCSSSVCHVHVRII